jgi:hypothetical protein
MAEVPSPDLHLRSSLYDDSRYHSRQAAQVQEKEKQQEKR